MDEPLVKSIVEPLVELSDDELDSDIYNLLSNNNNDKDIIIKLNERMKMEKYNNNNNNNDNDNEKKRKLFINIEEKMLKKRNIVKEEINRIESINNTYIIIDSIDTIDTIKQDKLKIRIDNLLNSKLNTISDIQNEYQNKLYEDKINQQNIENENKIRIEEEQYKKRLNIINDRLYLEEQLNQIQQIKIKELEEIKDNIILEIQEKEDIEKNRIKTQLENRSKISNIILSNKPGVKTILPLEKPQINQAVLRKMLISKRR